MANDSGRVRKVSGYAKRVFFNDNIEYRDFSDDLVGLQLTSEGGTPLFTMGNFSVTTNIEPTPSKTFNRGTFSDYYCLENISKNDNTFINIQGNLSTQLNLDITNPLHYVWYGNFKEYLRVSLEDISNRWAAAIYVDNKVGSISGNNITNYVYDPISDTTTLNIPTKYFINPFSIKYTIDAAFINDSNELNNLRNLTVNYSSYVIDINGEEFNIKEFTASTVVTNGIIKVVVDKELSSSITGTTGSIPFFIKPNEQERENFFTSLNEFQRNLLNRFTDPIYTVDIHYPQQTDNGVIVYTNRKITFPLLDDGYNLNFFNSLYISYLDELNEIADSFDDNQTNLMVRKYTAEIINSFDTAPRCDGDDLINNGQKATNLLNIYGREFDEIKRYVNGIKYAHVVTYNKKDNVPDSLVKDLAWMLGFEKIDFLSDIDLSKNLLPSNGVTSFSGYSKNYSLQEIDVELYRRLILNIAWLWKSKGARKAIEFLFRFIGAPESIVVFDEYVYVAEKPLDVEQVKRMLYLYTGDVDITNLPFDENGYPLPPVDGQLRTIYYTDPSGIQQSKIEEIYFQKGGGWYRETGGAEADIDINEGNNPHVGLYDAGKEYINYFTSECFIPNYSPTNTTFFQHKRLYENLFINYNYGLVNGIEEPFDLYVTPLTLNNQLINECVNLTTSIDFNCPPLSGCSSVTTMLQELCIQALKEYAEWVEKIKQEPYLVYSPEWEIIKRNHEVASKNYFDSVKAAACSDNACINVCVEPVETVETNPCDNWILVEDDEITPFIYFTDSDGNKVLFDEFPICCVANGGVYKEFVFQNGREACYCAKSAPCNGLIPSLTGRDGIVIWEQTPNASNVAPKDSIQIGEKCYILTSRGTSSSVSLNDLLRGGTDLINKYLELGYIETTPCYGDSTTLTTTKTSPECCVWYGYSFIKDSDGNIVCVDNSSLQGSGDNSTNTLEATQYLEELEREYTDAVSKYGEDSDITTQLRNQYETNFNLFNDNLNEKSLSINNLSFDGNLLTPDLEPNSNLNINTSLFITLPSQFVRLNKAVYLKYTTLNLTSDNFESAFENPDFNDCVIWQPKVDQNTGFVSFTVTDIGGEVFTLPEDRELYKNCCIAKGYVFGCFEKSGADGSFIPTTCEDNSGNLLKSASFNTSLIADINPKYKKCIDPDFISCDNIDDVKLIFSSNEWNGFFLPKEVNGECKLNINADIMIKYDAENLINCASENTCGFHYTQYDNSLYDTDCVNWITFSDYNNVLDDLSNNTQRVDLNEVINWSNINPDYVELGDYNISHFIPYFDRTNISVWQTPGLQSEPDQECCEALGGSLVETSAWLDKQKEERNNIQLQYNDIVNQISSGLEPTEEDKVIYEGIVELQNFNSQYNILTTTISCIDLTKFRLSKRPSKGFDFRELITTKNVCHLSIPEECGLYSILLESYWATLNQLELTRSELEECLENKETLTNQLNDLILQQREKQVEIKVLLKECENLILNYEQEINRCNSEVNKILNQIQILESSGDPFAATEINQLYLSLEETQAECNNLINSLNETKDNCNTQERDLQDDLSYINLRIEITRNSLKSLSCCTIESLDNLNNLITNVLSSRQKIIDLAQECYDRHNIEREENYQLYLSDRVQQVLNYIDDLEICLTLEVDKNLGNQFDLNRRYTTLQPYTKTVWTFDPYKDFTGIFIDGEPTNVNAVLQSLFVKMRERYGDESVTENTFVPTWQHVSLNLDNTQLQQLKTQYPDRPFFFGIAIKNYECNVCVLIDNISINIETDEIERKFSFEKCPSFDLKCVIDDRKSWVFSDGGVTKLIDAPGVGKCNLSSLSGNYNTIITYSQPQERRWLDLEYRNADYVVNHENLVINTKEASFRIDASKAIECDVYNFWQQINCESSGCTSAGTKSDCVITGYTDICLCSAFTSDSMVDPNICITCPDGYVLESDNSTCTRIIEGTLIRNSLTYSVTSGSTNDRYGYKGGRFYNEIDENKLPLTLSSAIKLNDFTGTEVTGFTIVSNSLWEQRLNNIGVWTTSSPLPLNEWIGFSHCIDVPSTGEYTIGIAADSGSRIKINGNTYMIMNQNNNFVYSIWHVFTVTLNTGRNIIEVEGYNNGVDPYVSFGAEIYDVGLSTLTGITTEASLSAITIFSTEEFRNNPYKTFDLGENSGFGCSSGFALQTCDSEIKCVSIIKESATEPCSGLTEEITICNITKVPIEVNPLDFLDKHPSEVNIKSDMDKMIVSNLIDVKSRQVISGYPLLWAFYELYLNASNCGSELTNRYDYNNLFEFTDLIGDYWLNLLEQVIPSTTIMDGCENTGKVYRNNIFDQPKFAYKKYSLNYFFENTDGLINGTNCTLDGITSEAIAEQRLCVDLTEVTVTGDNSSELEKCKKELNDLQWLIDNGRLSQTLKDEYITQIEEIKIKCKEIARSENIISGFYPLTQHNKVFITQIYDTNEYEGDVTVIGDDEWNKEDELINDCSESQTSSDVENIYDACWYSLPENPEIVMGCITTWNCGASNPTPPDYDHKFTITGITINGNEIQLSTPYSEDMNAVSGGTSDINWISADNDVVSGSTTGLTYTNFVEFLNNAFEELGIYPTYKAQISTTKTLNGLSGFYIIKPQTDAFSLLVIQDGYGPFDKIYSNEGVITPQNILSPNYEQFDCDGIVIFNGNVIE